MIFRREHGEANVASLVERKTRFGPCCSATPTGARGR